MTRFLLAGLTVWMTAPALAAGSVSIELLPEAHVPAGRVVLGQVARLRSTDLQLMRVLVDLPIGRAPAAGGLAVLGREELAAWIRARARIADAQVRWGGPASVRVLASGRKLPAEQVAAAASSALGAWLASQEGHSAFALQRLPGDIDVPADEIRLEARPLRGTQLRRRMLVWVDVWAAQRFVRAVPVAFSVSLRRQVAVAGQPLDAGASLGAGAAQASAVELTEEDGTPMLLDALDESLRTRRSVRPGEMIRSENVRKAPAVTRGQWASLRAAAGAVRLETRVQVLQDGRPGDAVRVRQPGATGPVLARVIGSGELEVAR